MTAEDSNGAPGYQAAPNTQHTFTQTQSEVGLAVTFFSEAASSRSSPTFHEGACVFGTVQVSFRKKRKMDSISVKLHGYQKTDQVQWLDQEEKAHNRVYFEQIAQLWPPPGSEKLSSMEPGTYNFPFSFNFPNETDNLGRSGSTYALPPSYSPPFFTDHLVYEVVACARRGGFFREDEFLITPIRYVPRPVAAAPSPARALAYKHHQPLPGPTEDPEGWHLQEMHINGKLYGRMVDASCELALAAPLDYPRGYPIPFRLTVRSSDTEALSALSSPGALSVSLNRMTVRFKRVRESESAKNKPAAQGLTWVGADRFLRAGEALLLGEIHVPMSLGPSFNYKTLSLIYNITVTPTLAGFELAKDAEVLNVPVQIAYFPAPDCKPRSYAPAANESERINGFSQAPYHGGLVTVV